MPQVISPIIGFSKGTTTGNSILSEQKVQEKQY